MMHWTHLLLNLKESAPVEPGRVDAGTFMFKAFAGRLFSVDKDPLFAEIVIPCYNFLANYLNID
jgi:hypothetical protein